MSYCAEADIRAIINTNRISDGLKDDRSAAVPAANLTAIIETSDSYIESYVTQQYPTLTADYSGTMPTVLKKQAALYAAGLALQRQGQRPGWMDDVRDWLKDIAAGEAHITGFDDASMADSTHREVRTSFSIKAMDGFGEPGIQKMDDGEENDPFEA